MATLPEDVDMGGSGPPPVPWWSAASPVGGDVVLSGVALLFVAVAFAFVLYHYFPPVNRCGSTAGVRVPSSSSAHQRGASGGLDAAAGGGRGRGRGGLDPDVLRALPVTPYRAKDHQAGDSELEALECAVCLAELADGEAARFLPGCGHGLHAVCVDPWLRGHPTCPLCRVDVSSLAALPPALPEPANYYPTNLPTNVLFWGSHDAFTAARTAGGPAPSATSDGASAAALVIEVREPPAPGPREGGAAKAQGLARLSSLRRLWNRGTRHDAVASASSHSCRRATAAGAGGTEQASAPPLHTSYVGP